MLGEIWETYVFEKTMIWANNIQILETVLENQVWRAAQTHPAHSRGNNDKQVHTFT